MFYEDDGMKRVAIEIKGISKRYDQNTLAINNISLKIYKGQWTVIMGPSGSGKTTLLNMISCLDRHTSGVIKVLNENLNELNNKALTKFRRENIGIIFQEYHLLPYLNALENVMVAQRFHSLVDKDSSIKALVDLGLSKRLNHIPSKLSGGEKQRVAIARALINEPTIILADEPTGNLDRKTGNRIMDIFKKLKSKGQTIIFITHDLELAKLGDRIIKLIDGKVSADSDEENKGLDEFVDSMIGGKNGK